MGHFLPARTLHCCIVICIYTCIYIYMLNGSQRHKDKRRVKTPLTKYTSHFIVTFVCERELETEHNCNILTSTLMAVSVVSFSFSRAAQPEAQEPSTLLDDGILYCILLPTGLVPNSSGAPSAPSAWRGFPYHISTPTLTVWLLSWLSYIIVQRTLNLLNIMFDCYQAEITVMQFRGHSLPVHQSMSVTWDFFYLVLFRQPISAYAISSHNCHWNVSLPSGASLWNGKFGRVEGRNTTRRATASCRGFSVDSLAFVPDGKCSMADLCQKGPNVRPGLLRAGELQAWHLCPPCIALDLALLFKL